MSRSYQECAGCGGSIKVERDADGKMIKWSHVTVGDREYEDPYEEEQDVPEIDFNPQPEEEDDEEARRPEA